MKSSAILIASVLVLASSAAEARRSPLSFSDGVVRLKGMATGGVITSLWADDSSLYVTFPAKKRLRRRRAIKTDHKIIRKVRLRRVRGKRAQIELVVRGGAGKLIQRLRVYELNGDLLIGLRDAAPAAPAIPPAVAGTDVGKKGKPKAKAEEPPAPKADKATTSEKAKKDAKDSKTKETAAAPKKSKKTKTAGLLGGKRGWGKKSLLGKSKDKEPGPSLATFWVLFLFVGLGGGVAWWLKRRKRGSVLGEANIDIVSCKPLSGKHRLLLVDANNELLLLGCTDRDIRLLRVMGPAKNQQDVENDWFNTGAPDQDDAYTMGDTGDQAPVGYPPVEVPQQPKQSGMSSFMAQLTQQIERRENDRAGAPAGQQEMEAEPLDEAWAQGIIKLRKARRTGAGANGSKGKNGSNGSRVDLLH